MQDSGNKPFIDEPIEIPFSKGKRVPFSYHFEFTH